LVFAREERRQVEFPRPDALIAVEAVRIRSKAFDLVMDEIEIKGLPGGLDNIRKAADEGICARMGQVGSPEDADPFGVANVEIGEAQGTAGLVEFDLDAIGLGRPFRLKSKYGTPLAGDGVGDHEHRRARVDLEIAVHLEEIVPETAVPLA
jgi:hypothetical protein